MRLPPPTFAHPAEVCETIIREHRQSPVRMGEFLMACGWGIADAAWAAVNWDLRTLAAAIAHERGKRRLGTVWIPPRDIEEFATAIVPDGGTITVSHAPQVGAWYVEARSSVANTTDWGTAR